MSLLHNPLPLLGCVLVGIGVGWAVGMLNNEVEYEFSTEVIAGFPESHAQKVREATGEASSDFDVVMRSSALIHQAVERYKLDLLEGLKREADVSATIREGISTTRLDAATSTYEVRFRHANPQTARSVCKAMVANYSDLIGVDPAKGEPESLRAILQARLEPHKVLHELGAIADQKRAHRSVPPELERREEELEKLLVEKEAALAYVLAENAAAIKELIRREPTVVVLKPDQYNSVRPRLWPAMITGALVGAVLGMLLKIGKFDSDRRESDDDE